MTFNLTPKRIAALRLIAEVPGIRCGEVAHRVLPRASRLGIELGYSQQGATRVGSGYCIALEKAGFISIERYGVIGGYGKCYLTSSGRRALADAAKAEEERAAADSSLDAVLSRCVDPEKAPENVQNARVREAEVSPDAPEVLGNAGRDRLDSDSVSQGGTS